MSSTNAVVRVSRKGNPIKVRSAMEVAEEYKRARQLQRQISSVADNATVVVLPSVSELPTCDVCGAVCSDRKDLKRFQRRHPALCAARRDFNKQLAEGVRSVED